MSIRNVFNRSLDLKYLQAKYLIQRKICRQLCVQSVKYQNNTNTLCSNMHVISNGLLYNTKTTTSRFPSWKWLAISLLYTGYDGQSELKFIIYVLIYNFEC